MIKSEKVISGYKITQFQLGYFSIQMDDYLNNTEKKPQRTLLASNIYSVEYNNEIWIMDSGYSPDLNISFIEPRLKYTFKDILDKFNHYHNVYFVLSHCHPDHIGGIIENFDRISEQNRKLFITKETLDSTFYSDFIDVERFIENELKPYPFLFDLKHAEIINPLFIGGHTPEHTIVQLKNSNVFYPSDLVPTEYHIKHLPHGEKNYSQEEFVLLREDFLNSTRGNDSTLLLSHAPNDGIISF